ncbi:MAG: L-threonylcarbamoyladenylate synthase [Bdellovibrionales bacterium]|jgi:L-threonylcarbamoyladenylate synthase|nr:L-threonylcarbamoyladenylate synthase [Bdellovibrionales bacterium]
MSISTRPEPLVRLKPKVYNPSNVKHAPSSEQLKQAALHLKAGKCVAMPTETVYGLAARFDLPKAVEAVFRIKERPSFDPLIVHVSTLDEAKNLTSNWSPLAQSLADAFWPGPLTMVLPKHEHVSSMITSGLDTVGIRMPRHPIALELIRLAGAPLAAPSANRFGRTSPTSAHHVASEFPEAIAQGEVLILDGGESDVGIESTVCMVQWSENPSTQPHQVVILRPGEITEAELREHFLNTSSTLNSVAVTRAMNNQASPGHTEHHYMPRKPLIVSWGDASLAELRDGAHTESRNVNVRALWNQLQVSAKNDPSLRILELDLSNDPTIAARKLYAELRNGDADSDSDLLFIRRSIHDSLSHGGFQSKTSQDGMSQDETVVNFDKKNQSRESDLWAAIDDRLRRAARFNLGNPR